MLWARGPDVAPGSTVRRAPITIIQLLYWVSFGALLTVSWWRSRGILHPHFMFCVMLLVLASDFMIRGNDDPNLAGITDSNLVRYQLVTLATLIGIGLSTALVRKPYELSGRIVQPEMQVSAATAWMILIGGTVLLAIHQTYRLNAIDWSFTELLRVMLGPREGRIWDLPNADGIRDPIYQLFNGMIPLVAIAFAFLIFARRTAPAILGGLLLSLLIFILITDGSRTQAMIPLASLAIFGLLSLRSVVAKALLLSGVLALIALATSAMILFRAQGLENASSSFALTYHQDDNIYRLWAAAAFADFSSYRWDPFYFFYYVLSNPIPRILWPDKPLLDENFYGGFKLWWVTISFMGEWVSMFGTWVGFLVSFLFGNLLYRGFYFSQRLLTMPLGVTAYLLVALYVYMVIRGMPNLTIFSYAPAAALLMVWIAGRRNRVATAVAIERRNRAWSS